MAITALLMASAYGSAAAAPLADPPPMRTRIVLRGVHFEFNQWNIRPGDDAVLDEAIAVLRTHPRLIIWIDGYTDSIGDAKINKAISDMRAISVAEYLENHGVYPSQCMPIGYGKTDFVASNKTDEGRAQNRRVELVQSNIR
ncbi:MAG: OmpA family protein [Candidatus Binataceae bacterium]